MCSLGHHHNGFVPTHALEHMLYGYTLLVTMNQNIYILYIIYTLRLLSKYF